MSPFCRYSPLFLWVFVQPLQAWDYSWVRYTAEEKNTIYIGVYKPLIWSLLEADTQDDPSTPFDNEGVSRFDLKDVVKTNESPTGVFLSANFFGIVEPRVGFEWFAFAYRNGLGFQGKVDRKDYALDVLLGYDLNRFNTMQWGGFIYQFYPYAFAGIGFTDYDEKITSNGQTRNGNVILADVHHFDLGIGSRFGLIKLLNAGAELGFKAREFKTVNGPQPDGIASEGYLRVYIAAGYGR